MTTCKLMVRQFCNDVRPQEILPCLKRYKNEMNFDSKCRKLVLRRQVMQSQDYRLNPKLMRDCKQDIPKFCSAIMEKEKNDHLLEGKVIGCLKSKFAIKRLSTECENNIRGLVKDAALDYRQDPILAKACKMEIKEHCLSPDGSELQEGHVEECLRNLLENQKITNVICKKQVARTIVEGHIDIEVDPLLYRACAVDIKHICRGVPRGEGRLMSCMLAAIDNKAIASSMDTTCRKMLHDRIEMWEYASKLAPPETVKELVGQISTSPSKNYFIALILAVIGFIFIGGLFCGRVTKRIRTANKNK